MKVLTQGKACIVLAAIMFICLPSPAWSQDPPPTQQDPEQQKQDNPPPASPADVTPAPGGAAPPLDTQIHAAGQAMPFFDSRTPLRFGPFSLASIEYINVYDEFYPAGNLPQQNESLNLFRANIDFTLPFKKNLFVLQYTPELAILNGSVRGGADGDTGLTVGQTLHFTPRLTVTLNDAFAVNHTRQLFPDQFLLIDEQNGGVIQAYFLENPGTRIQDTFTAAFNYKWTQRLTLTVVPGYIYSDTHTLQTPYIIEEGNVMASLTYALTEHRNIGYVQSVEVLHPILPVGTNGLFRTSGVFYSEQLSPTWWVTGKLGLEAATYPGFKGTDLGVTGSGNVLKTFSKSDIAVAYSRASTITTFATNRQIEEVDLLYGIHLTQRIRWTNGAGLFHETGGDPRTSGKYATSNLEFHLPANFFLLASYSRRNQESPTPQVLSGNRNTFTFGIRWAPPPIVPHQ